MPYFFLTLSSIFVLWICIANRTTRKGVMAHLKSNKQKQKGELCKMLKLIETLVGKNCHIHTIDNAYEGMIERVEDGWIVIKDRWYNSSVLVNPEYVVGIRECKDKKKKKEEKAALQECAATTPENE